MATVVQVDPNEVHAAASRWQMIGADLGARGAPSVGTSTNWPSAAATAGIHGQAATATEAFQARIEDTAAASQVAANTFQTQDTKVGADAFKDMLSSVSSMIGMFSGSLGSVNAATSDHPTIDENDYLFTSSTPSGTVRVGSDFEDVSVEGDAATIAATSRGGIRQKSISPISNEIPPYSHSTVQQRISSPPSSSSSRIPIFRVRACQLVA